MKKFTCMLLFCLSAFGQELTQLQSQLDALRPELNQHIQTLVVQKLQVQLIHQMETSGLPQEALAKVLRGTTFENYKNKVLADPQLQASISRLLDQTLNAQNIKQTLHKYQTQTQELDQMQLQTAQRAFLQYKMSPLNSSKDRTWLEKTKTWIQEHIFG